MAERTDSVPEDEERTRSAARQEGSDERRREQRGGYLGFVAHEVRNPLSTALWSAELLARLSPDERGGPRGEKLTGMCLRALTRVRILVEDHFLAERLDVGGLPVRLEEVPLREAIEAAIGRLPSPRAPCEAEISDVAALADGGLLERALDALLSVAGQGGASVRVEGAERRGEVTLRFRGAEPAAHALADPRRDTPSDPKGRPLGLAMARRAAETMGGSLLVVDGAYELSLRAATGDGGPASERP